MTPKKPGIWWVWTVWVLILVTMASACMPGPEPTEPAIILDPSGGGPGTIVSVAGSGFPAGMPVSVRLGPPSVGATPQSYADGITDAGGGLSFAFTMPARWPDGTPIAEIDLVVVVLNEDGSVKATAPFAYRSAASGALAMTSIPVATPRQAILTWHREEGAAGACYDVAVYEGGYAEIASSCLSAPVERRLLSAEAVAQLEAWQEAYASFAEEETEGTGERRVTTRITFNGTGSRRVSEAEMGALRALLERLLAP